MEGTEQDALGRLGSSRWLSEALERGFPTVVEIEVNSRCNRKCTYCPVSILPLPSEPKHMSDGVFETLLTQLREFDFAGRLSYHFYNEPLLRRDLERLIRSAKTALPDAVQVLYTNGDLLTDERYQELVAAGIGHFLITDHNLNEHVFVSRPLQTVRTFRDLDLTNRAGTLFQIPVPLSLPCYAPAEMVIVTVTGDVLLCYEDAKRQNALGNVMEKPLRDIWFSEVFVEKRRQLALGRRDLSSEICRHCDNRAHTQSGTSWSPF